MIKLIIMRKYFYGFCLIFSSLLVTLIFIEIVLLYFPVNQGLRTQAVNESFPIFRFKPNREVQYSKNWNFSLRNRVKINNFGFVSNFNYYENLTTPLLAIIGDSYVEALMVPFDKTITGITNKKAKVRGGRVYSFAASGAGLSQHMIWAKYAKETFKPDAYVFVIIANDFMESLHSYESSPGFHRFKFKEDEKWDMVLEDYEPSILRKVFRNSSLAMYLITNLKIHAKLKIPLILGRNDKRISYIGNVNGVMNAVIINGKPVGESVLQGEGAGPGPTSSSLLSDFLSILRGNIKYPFGMSSSKRKSINYYSKNFYINSLYLRFEVKDKPGVLSEITNRLAKYKISVKRIIQTPDKKNKTATIVIITHKTNELNSNNCLSVFKKNKNIIKNPTLIRLYN